jgi:carboxyl-terminal processing protease
MTRTFVGTALVVSVALNVLFAVNPSESAARDETGDLALVKEAIDVVQKNLHPKGFSQRELVEAAIEGMLLRVDPDGAYLDQDDLSFYNQSARVKRGYVGLVVRFERHLVVVGSRPGSSAFGAGILPGDHVLEIDGRSVADMSMEKASQSLVGIPQTCVRLKVTSTRHAVPRLIRLTRAG